MQLIINRDLDFSTFFSSDASDDELNYWQDHFLYIKFILEKYSVRGIYTVTEGGAEFKIFGQKIAVDEVAMNHLFADALSELFFMSLAYCNLGGEGCDLSLRVITYTQK